MQGNVTKAGCVSLHRIRVEGRNPNLGDTTQGGGKIMRWCLTEEHRVQSIRKCVELEEGSTAGYGTGWERDGFSVGLRRWWLLCPTQEEEPKPPGFSEDQPNPPPGGSGGYCRDDTMFSASSSIILLPVLYPPIPILTQRKGYGSDPMWSLGWQSEKPFNAHPSPLEKIRHHFCSAKTPAPFRLGKLWLKTKSQETSAPAWVFKCVWWVMGDYCCLKYNSKAAELLSPMVPALAALVVPTVVEWGPETLALSCLLRRGKTFWEAVAKSCSPSTGSIGHENKDVGC